MREGFTRSTPVPLYWTSHGPGDVERLLILHSVQSAHGHAAPPPARLVLIDPTPASRRWRRAFEAEFSRPQRSPEVLALRADVAASGLRESDPAGYRPRAGLHLELARRLRPDGRLA